MMLSIILPVYNVEPYLQRCLDSLADLLVYGKAELIIVNDGSTDNSLQIAEKFALLYDNISVVTQPNAGLSAARNKGFKYAKGDYVWFVDSDDFIDEQEFVEIWNYIDTKEYDVLVFGRIDEYVNKAKRNVTLMQSTYDTGISYFNDSLAHDAYRTNAWDKIFRKDFLDEHNIRFIEGRLYEDMLFCFEVFLYAKKVIQCNCYPYHYNLCNMGSITKRVREKDLDVLWYIEEADRLYNKIIVSDRFSRKAYNQMVFNWVNSCIIKKYASLYFKDTVARKICVGTFNDRFFRNSVIYCATHKVKARQWIMSLLILLSPKFYCRIVAFVEMNYLK